MDLTCEPLAPLRQVNCHHKLTNVQSQERFRSPDISRRPLGGEALAAYTVKKSRRAKSTVCSCSFASFLGTYCS